jgi:hypothetical protein
VGLDLAWWILFPTSHRGHVANVGMKSVTTSTMSITSEFVLADWISSRQSSASMQQSCGDHHDGSLLIVEA